MECVAVTVSPTPRAKPALAVGLALAGVLAAVAGPGATGAPGTGWIGHSDPERGAGEFLRDAGLEGADGIPKFPEDVTELTYCATTGPCRTRTYPASESVSFGILPLYAGSVTIKLAMGHEDRDAFTCTVPGGCKAFGTGSSKAASFHVRGVPEPGTAGAYLLWVMFS